MPSEFLLLIAITTIGSSIRMQMHLKEFLLFPHLIFSMKWNPGFSQKKPGFRFPRQNPGFGYPGAGSEFSTFDITANLGKVGEH